MVTVVTAGSKQFIAAITNEDYLKLTGQDAMPENYHHWRKNAEAGHGNPLFDTDGERRWFAAFGKAGHRKATHRVVERRGWDQDEEDTMTLEALDAE